jgi:hypothetical protein
MTFENRPDVAVVVLSCDRYSDLWGPFFELYFRNWSGIDLPVYLCANRQTLEDSRVVTALSGEDPDWSTSIGASLAQVPHDYVLLVFDDVFFDKPVDPPSLQRLLDFVQKRQPSYLRFRAAPKPDERIDAHFGRIHEETIYRTSVFGLWRRSTLIELLEPGESAWEFEYNSPQRARSLPDFYGVYDTYFSYIHAIEKGLWIPDAYDRTLALGVQPDLSRRRLMTADEERHHKRGRVREAIFNAVPAVMRPFLIQAKRALRRTRAA